MKGDLTHRERKMQTFAYTGHQNYGHLNEMTVSLWHKFDQRITSKILRNSTSRILLEDIPDGTLALVYEESLCIFPQIHSPHRIFNPLETRNRLHDTNIYQDVAGSLGTLGQNF
jgi:hypothetical protein